MGMQLKNIILLFLISFITPPLWADGQSDVSKTDGTAFSIPDCTEATEKLHYTLATKSWDCKTDQTGGGGGAVFSVFGRTGDVVAAANDYSWAQIASKPSTFPPDAHGHTEAEVTNLVTDLAAKVPTSRRIDTKIGRASCRERVCTTV